MDSSKYQYALGQQVEFKRGGAYYEGRVSFLDTTTISVQVKSGRRLNVERSRVRPVFAVGQTVDYYGQAVSVYTALGNTYALRGPRGLFTSSSVYEINPLPQQASVGIPKAEPAKSYKDTSKAPLEELLAIPDALEEIARLFRWAHDTKGYRFKAFETLDPSELRNALMRHTFQTGIKHLELDDQSKMLHAIHAAANGLLYVQNLINRSKSAN